MLKIGVTIAIIFAAGFFAFPQFRPAIIGIAPFALFAICPIAMFFGMKGMKDDSKKGGSCSSSEHQHLKKEVLKPSSADEATASNAQNVEWH